MSLLFFDGFNNYTFLPLKWEECTKNNQFSIKNSVGRASTKALCVYSGLTNLTYDHLGKVFSSNIDTIIVGFAFKKVKTDYGFIEIDFNKGESIQSKIKLYDTSFSWFRGDESVNYGMNFSLQFNAWNYFEVKIKTHQTLGTVEIRINEKVVLTLTNINTTTVAFDYIDRIRFRLRHISQTNEDYAYIDDLYIADAIGAFNNTFLGNCTTSNFYPTSQGTFSQFSLPSTVSGVANYTMVNEQVYPEDTTTYNATFLEYASGDDGSTTRGLFSNSSTTGILACANGYDNIEYLWFRFSNINIPKMAKIVTVNLRLYVEAKATAYDFYDCTAGFQKSGTPVSQVVDTSDVSTRLMTDGAYIISRIQTIEPTTLNYKDSLQDLVSMNNWQEEDNIVLFIMSHRNASNAAQDLYRVRTYDYSNDPFNANSPKLYVEWQLPSGASGSSYVKSTTLDNKDSYRLSTVSGITNIFAVKQNIIAKRYLDRANTDDLYLMPIVTNGITTYSGSTKLYFSDTYYKKRSVILEQNPLTTSNWLPIDLQDYEFGFITTYSG